MLLLCTLRQRQWLVAAAWLIVAVLLPATVELSAGTGAYQSYYIPPVTPYFYRHAGDHEWPVAYLLCLGLAVTMLRMYQARRNFYAHILLGLFLAGGALSALDKFNIRDVYLPARYEVAQDRFVVFAEVGAAAFLELGRFPTELPLHQYWDGPDEDERRVSLRIPCVTSGLDVRYPWQFVPLTGFIWAPLLLVSLIASVPLLVNRRRYPVKWRHQIPIMGYANRPAL